MNNDMPLIIADTYQVISQIGSGGGGIVYLAEHMRLNKKVVLKADKRDLSTKQDVLRREVDALKDLSHTYIPQVYDFIAEDGTVYTVMDFIDGESFDKPLKRGERFSQSSIIEWACQLLSALDYLHSRPPHGILHADIKPSNVMLTPEGDIRLIDFNIALALGEEGAVAVGRSFGYASPEHYGLDYSTGNVTRGINTDIATDLSSKSLSDIETVLETKPEPSSSGSISGKKKIMLDVRSDIYSLGATLYHIMSGERPAQNATAVKPISPKEFSPAVIAIIERAMNPNPNLRYQSVKEMLYDFEHLWDNDPRTKRSKRITAITATILTLIFLTGGFSTLMGQRQMEQEQRLLAEEQRILAEEQRQLAEEQAQLALVNEAYALAEYSTTALQNGDVDGAINYAIQALNNSPIAEAQKALTAALNIYDLSDGFKHHKTIELDAAPLFLQASPSGNTFAAIYAYSVAIVDTDTGEIIKTLPTEKSALAEVKYISESVIVYAGDGGIRAYDIETDTKLWSGEPCTIISVSADTRTVAAIYKNDQTATVYDASSGQVLHEVDFDGKHQRVTVNDSFANPNDNLLALNADGSMLAVSFADGSLWVYDLHNSDGDIEIFDNESGFTHYEGGFNGRYLAFSASNTVGSIFAVIDTVEVAQTGGFNSTFPFSVQADESGIYLQTENILVKIHPETGEQTSLVTMFEEITRFDRSNSYKLITTKTQYMFFDRYANWVATHDKEYGSEFIQITEITAIIGSLDSPIIRIMKSETHSETEIFTYDPAYKHDEARVSADRKTVMLFGYDEFVLYDMSGQIIKNVFIPDAEQVYDQQYRRDDNGSRLEVIYNDGTIRAYSAEDGSLLSETIGETPDLSLYEEFFTDKLRIESPLHGTPTAYDHETGELVRELEKDAYLTYVTQVGEYIITEYISAEGERYGLLLNGNCETLARLPYLCDIVGDILIFDYPTGSLRETRIYSIQELIALANEGGHTHG